MATEETKYQPKDYKSDQYVRWCPGCGDHAILNCLHKAMAEVGVAPHNMAVISGIGCSSRLPYYMNTYGFHTIHGRGAAIATGVKTARPDLSVWLITGDGDCLAIGGNHFIHAVRRNIDLNIVLFNNKIYGLTKGQYSPTSDRGFVSKSSPYGTVEDPFIPAELALGARGNFFARAIDVDLKNTTEILAASARHKGAAVTEVLVNCMIFNNGIHKQIVDKEFRADRTIFLRHGEKMIYGKDNPVDGLIMKVILEKARQIRDSLGVLVPVPENGKAIQSAMIQATMLKQSTDNSGQLYFDFGEIEEVSDSLEKPWQDAADKAKRNRTIFAQRSIHPDEVMKVLSREKAVLGSDDDTERFVTAVIATVTRSVIQPSPDHCYIFNLDSFLDESLRRDAQDRGLSGMFKASFRFPAPMCFPTIRTGSSPLARGVHASRRVRLTN